MALEPLTDSAQFALDTFAHMQEIYIAIRNRIYDAKLTAKEQYDKHRVDREFQPGQLVWLYTPSSDRSKPGQLNAKYRPIWAGPFRVVQTRRGEL